MPFICYEDKNFQPATLDIIWKARQICEEYEALGYNLTLRQLYYQFVSRDWLPNSQQSYNRLGGIINDARMAGLIDWNWIVDRTRNLQDLPHWNSPQDIMEQIGKQYRNDKWADQPNRVECWIEKDALVGVLDAACTPMDVPYFSCRGYTSSSEVWGAAQRLRGYIENGQRAVILHLGDHDPSGVDMTRDISERLFTFISHDLCFRSKLKMRWYEAQATARGMLEIKRIALNMSQVRQYEPPPNPAKYTDSRYADYVEKFGRSCWELDALPPDVLVALIQAEIVELREDVRWNAAKAKEKKEKTLIQKAAKRWPEVVKLMTFIDKKEKAS